MLNVIPTHPEANSYITIAEADAVITSSSWTGLTTTEKERKILDAMDIIDSHRFFDYPVISHPKYYRDKQYLAFPRGYSFQYTCTIQSATITSVTTNVFKNNGNFFSNFCKDWALIITDGTGRGQTGQILSYDNGTGTITLTANLTTEPDITSRVLIIEKIPPEIKKATIAQVKYMLSVDQSVLDAQAMGIKSRSIDDISETYTNQGSRLLSTEVQSILQGYIDITGSLC